MNELDKKYASILEDIKSQIQASDELAVYLDEEDDELYNELKSKFEPQLEALHNEVADNDPLQLESLEKAMLDVDLEGMFLPRILGYSVLRGAYNNQFKYIRPQEHFKQILLSICNSSNFEILSNRIGQTIEVGFALSSDIWITNLIAEIDNKVVKSFLSGLKHPKYRDVRSRHTSYKRYSKQFKSFNFLTAALPTSNSEIKIEYQSIVNFLLFRGSRGSQTSQSVYGYIKGFLDNASLGTSIEHLEILMIIGFFFDLKEAEQNNLRDQIDGYQNFEEEEEAYFSVIRNLQDSENGLNEEDYARLQKIVVDSKSVILKDFLATLTGIDSVGYLNTDAIDIARNYHNNNKGLSPQNDCLRHAIFSKFKTFLGVLAEEDFNEYFEMNKVFTTYMNAFDNEQFNQNIKGISMTYVKKLLRKFTEKRSKDYQDIKKFVSAVFLDLGFLKEKEIKELFKTKRKKTVAQ